MRALRRANFLAHSENDSLGHPADQSTGTWRCLTRTIGSDSRIRHPAGRHTWAPRCRGINTPHTGQKFSKRFNKCFFSNSLLYPYSLSSIIRCASRTSSSILNRPSLESCSLRHSTFLPSLSMDTVFPTQFPLLSLQYCAPTLIPLVPPAPPPNLLPHPITHLFSTTIIPLPPLSSLFLLSHPKHQGRWRME